MPYDILERMPMCWTAPNLSPENTYSDPNTQEELGQCNIVCRPTTYHHGLWPQETTPERSPGGCKEAPGPKVYKNCPRPGDEHDCQICSDRVPGPLDSIKDTVSLQSGLF